MAPLDILESLERPWAVTETISVKNAHCYDAISQYIPYDYSVYKSLREDGYIGWNPDVHGGTAIRENHMLCPSSLRHLFYRFLPFWDAWDLGRICHYFLAGLGMILLLSAVGLPAWGGLLGAIAYSFSSQMIVWVHSDVIASGCCWSPWMIWSLVELRKRIPLRTNTAPSLADRLKYAFWILLSGGFIGIALRAGFLHTTLFNGSLLILFLIDAVFPRKGSSVTRISDWLTGFIVTGIGLLIALPCLLTVVPPALHGGHALRSFSMWQGIKALPTLATTVLPTVFGAPETIDVSKLFGADFLCVKFAGGTVFVLALLACFQKQVPRLPKLLMLLFLLIPFTPLAKWYYSRCFILSALGMAWLAGWRLHWQINNPKTHVWHRILQLFCGACLLWVFASVVLHLAEPRLLPKLQAISVHQLPAIKASRSAWVTQRTGAFYHQCLIWSSNNLLALAALGIGLFSAAGIRKDNPRNRMLIAGVVLGTFMELLLFGSHVIYAANRPVPTEDAPFPEREWVFRFKSHLSNGSVVFWHDQASYDFDYMQINAPSAHGIRQAEGYESVQPARLAPLNRNAFDPNDFALAGISHVSTPPGEPFPNAGAWRLVEASPDYDLYENPAFRSIFLARLADGTEVPLFTQDETPNSFRLSLPAGTTSLRLAMTHHPGWSYRLGVTSWSPLPASSDGYRAAEIVFPDSLPEETHLYLRFR